MMNAPASATPHFCAGFGNGTEVVNEVGLGHTNASIADGEDLVLLVGNNTD